MKRAYSLLTIKALDDEKRIITGMATTPTPDRIGDIVEPDGASFALPIPLLWQHDASKPIGHVTNAKVTKAGIEIVAQLQKLDEPGVLKDRLDEAWQSIQLGLVRGLSIGFKELEFERIKSSFSVRFLKWLWLELSAVTIPANGDATIQTVKSIDSAQRAASGQKSRPVVCLDPPVVSGSSTHMNPKVDDMRTLAEQITALETRRAANAARMESIMQKSLDESRSTDEAEQEEFDTLEGEVETVDKDLKRLRSLERVKAQSARPVIKADNEVEASNTRGRGIEIKMQPKLEPGQEYAQLVKVKTMARLVGDSPLLMAQRMYGTDSAVVGIITKANEVVAGTTVAGNWAANLVSAEGAAVAAFLEFLRPQTIVGRFGQGGIPNLTRIDFYSPFVTQTGGGAAYWVGEGKPKPLTSFDWERNTLTPAKIANIAVLTDENMRYSTPNSDMLVRNSLVAAIAEELDLTFVDPANAGVANVKPASITNGAESIVSSGDTAEDIRLDVRAVFQKFIDANNPPSSGVWIMSASNALALASMYNPLGQQEFGTVSMSGGTFVGTAGDRLGAHRQHRGAGVGVADLPRRRGRRGGRHEPRGVDRDAQRGAGHGRDHRHRHGGLGVDVPDQQRGAAGRAHHQLDARARIGGGLPDRRRLGRLGPDLLIGTNQHRPRR